MKPKVSKLIEEAANEKILEIVEENFEENQVIYNNYEF
jgi:hypothetical protein